MQKIKQGKNVVPMLMKAFRVIEVFRELPEGLSYMEAVKRCGEISKVSIYRILRSLEALGYLEKDKESNRYQLGAKFIELGRLTEKRQDLIKVAAPFLERLVDKYGENVNLARIEGRELVYLDSLEGTFPIVVREMPSRQLAIYSSSIGKAILAFLKDDDADRLLQSVKLRRLTENTITSKKALQKELTSIREVGFAQDNEENTLGVRCVGAPILRPDGHPLAAISISGPSIRINSRKAKEMGSQLQEICSQISESLFGKVREEKEAARF